MTICKVEQISVVVEENSAATKEVTASTEELMVSAQPLSTIFDDLKQTIRKFIV